MQIKTSVSDGNVVVDVIDPSDGAVTHSIPVGEGEQVIVTATTAHSPADLEVGEVGATPEPEAEQAEGDGEAAEAPEDADGEGDTPEGDQPDGDGAAA